MNATLIKFMITALFFGTIAVIISIAWPRFMGTPRPEPIARVYQAVSQTQIGRDMGSVLGVSVEGTGEPFNLEAEMQRISSMAITAVEDQAKTLVARHAIIQLKNQYDTLPNEMKTEIQRAICVSLASNSAISVSSQSSFTH